MPTLIVDIQEGFDGQSVEIVCGTRVMATGANLHTRMQIGLAGRLVLELDAGEQCVEVRVPEHGTSVRIRLDAAQTPYLTVNQAADGLAVQALSEAPSYL